MSIAFGILIGQKIDIIICIIKCIDFIAIFFALDKTTKLWPWHDCDTNIVTISISQVQLETILNSFDQSYQFACTKNLWRIVIHAFNINGEIELSEMIDPKVPADDT